VRLSPSDEGALEPLGRFDVVFAVEVLQLVPFTRSLRALWAQVVPGGRLVAMVANGACPIVRRTRSRFDDRYLAPTAASLADDLAQLPDVAHAAVRGCHFRDDQALVPYEAGPWQAPGPATWTEEPNRIQFALVRRA
jgi:hypothetical protein